jgi:glycosyltransferase involved in cell wall biosynthesis
LIVIDEPYLLAVCVPVKIDTNGGRWCNELWAKDLALHLEYLTDLTLACPCVFAEPASTDQSLSVSPFNRLKFVDLPSSRNYREALSNFPKMISELWNGAKSSNIVHAGFGGWPISEGWLAIPIGRLQKKFIISYVESSFWRVSSKEKKWRRRFRGSLIEHLNRFCVKMSDLRFFTSRAYESDFLGPGDHFADHSFVTPATWIDETVILSDEQAVYDWNNKEETISFLFAARLVADKGVQILLDAIDRIARDVNAHVTIIGEGPLADACRQFVIQHKGSTLKVELMQAVQYGDPFFELLRRFDAVIVPSVSDEQPRLIFDAFSQSIPVLGSDTGGIAEVVDEGVNGRLFKSGDASALEATLRWACENRNSLRAMGTAALKKSRQFTHRAMHEHRSRVISAEREASTLSKRR